MKKTVMVYLLVALMLVAGGALQVVFANETAEVEAVMSVNLNQADVVQLQTLPGIGPALAERVVAHREANGLFASVDQLSEVKGIGQRKLEKLRGHLVLE